MFGRNTDDDSSQDDNSAASTPVQDTVTPQTPHEESAITPVGDQSWQHPGEPIASAPALAPEVSISAPPVATSAKPPEPSDDVPMPNTKHDDEIVDMSAHELIDIKQKALGQLNPLMDHLDQTPEEKFRTTMMMIQASDDQTLVKTAYEAAQKITDEKTRAQALLDIVNEINYFTQHHNS